MQSTQSTQSTPATFATPATPSDWQLPFAAHALRKLHPAADRAVARGPARDDIAFTREPAPETDLATRSATQSQNPRLAAPDFSATALEEVALREARDRAEDIARTLDNGADFAAQTPESNSALVSPDLTAWLTAGADKFTDAETAQDSRKPTTASTRRQPVATGARKKTQTNPQNDSPTESAAAAPQPAPTRTQSGTALRFFSGSADYFERRFTARARLRPRR